MNEELVAQQIKTGDILTTFLGREVKVGSVDINGNKINE